MYDQFVQRLRYMYFCEHFPLSNFLSQPWRYTRVLEPPNLAINIQFCVTELFSKTPILIGEDISASHLLPLPGVSEQFRMEICRR